MPNGTSAAVTEITRLNDIGFPEFTAKLINDVFEALLLATLRQMEAFSELLAATAKTLTEYATENKDSVSGEEVWEWLVKNLPGPSESAKAASGTSPLTPADETLVKINNKLNQAEIKSIYDKTGTGLADPPETTPQLTQLTLTQTHVNTITDNVRKIIAGNRYTLLKEMVKLGIIRLVVDYGEIETKLTFSTFGMSEQETRSLDSKVKSLGVGATSAVTTGASLSPSIKKIGSLGISRIAKTSFAANYSAVSVKATSSIDRDVSGSKVDIYARVFIRFKSDYQSLGG